jgi:hypothetical protein
VDAHAGTSPARIVASVAVSIVNIRMRVSGEGLTAMGLSAVE